MAVVIRMQLFGTKRKPTYRIVAITKTTQRNGKILEELGHYDPRKKADKLVLKDDRIKFWIGKGARPSERIKSIMKKTGI